MCTAHSAKEVGVYLKSTISSWTYRTFWALEGKEKKEFCIKKSVLNINVRKNTAV